MTRDFEAFLRSVGLIPGRIAADGRIRRCPTEDKPKRKNGAYLLAPDGRMGWGQVHGVHDKVVLWFADAGAELPEISYLEIRQRNEALRAQRLDAIRRAQAFYASCSPLLGGHPYLAAKGLGMTGCRGLKVDARARLVVPMLVGGQVASVQRIADDGTKRFWSGAPTRGTSYTIDRRAATVTVLCEGLATGLAIFAAVPNSRVVVAFTAGNLRRVAERLPRRGFVVVAADNDHATEARRGVNPGIVAAQDAAGVLGCGVAVPEGMEGSDFCDLREERIAAALAPTYGRILRESDVRRRVDGEIARTIMRAATFVSEVAG